METVVAPTTGIVVRGLANVALVVAAVVAGTMWVVRRRRHARHAREHE